MLLSRSPLGLRELKQFDAAAIKAAGGRSPLGLRELKPLTNLRDLPQGASQPAWAA